MLVATAWAICCGHRRFVAPLAAEVGVLLGDDVPPGVEELRRGWEAVRGYRPIRGAATLPLLEAERGRI